MFENLRKLLKFRQLAKTADIRGILQLVRDFGPTLADFTDTDLDDQLVAAIDKYGDEADALIVDIQAGDADEIVGSSIALISAIVVDTENKVDDFAIEILHAPMVRQVLVFGIQKVLDGKSEKEVLQAVQTYGAEQDIESVAPGVWIFVTQAIIWAVRIIRDIRTDDDN